MASSWREAAQKLFGGDRLSHVAGEIEESMKRIQEEEGDMLKDRDYRVLRLATLCRYKDPVKVRIYPESLMAMRKIGNSSNPVLTGPYLDPKKPPKAPFEHKGSGCDKDCYVCFPQYFVAQCSISIEDAQETTSTLADVIENDYNYLRGILETHADELAKRWNKMSQKKRQSILDENGDLFAEQPALVHLTNANMKNWEDWRFRRMARETASFHIPEDRMEFLGRYVAHHMIPVILEAMKSKVIDTWLLPYLDLESLSRSPLSFLSLLNSRTQHPPWQWTLFDKMHIVAAEHFQIIPSQYNSKCISFHPDDYGRLRDWDRELAHRQTILGYTQGIFVLTAQGRMMSLLKKVVDSILYDIQHRRHLGEAADYDEPGATERRSVPVQQKWAQLVGNGFSTFGMQPRVTKSSYTNQHLVAPPQADPVVLSKKIRAVYQDAFDGLWALQTDPSAVQLAVKELCSCIYFHYLDKAKEWDRIADEVLLVPMRRELLWRQTLKECDRLMSAHDTLKREDTEKSRLRFDASMMVLHDCCTEQLTWAIRDLQYSLPYQPGFEKNYEWQRGSDGKRRTPRIYSKDWFIEDPLFWSLDCFCNDRYREFNCDPIVYLRAFDSELEKATGKERRRVSPSFLTLVSDLAAIDEIRTAIQCTRGINLNSMQEYSTDPRFKAESKQRFDDAKIFNETRNDLLHAGVDDLCNAAAPSLRKLCTQYPWPKGRPATDTAQRAADARDILANVWEQIRRVFNRAIVKNGMSGPHMKEYMDKWSLDMSQEYQSLRQAEQSEIEAALQSQLEARTRSETPKIAPPLRAKLINPVDSSLPLNLRKVVLQDLSTNKSKIKTRGKSVDKPSSPRKDDSAMAASVEVEIQQIKVKLDSLPLLHQMFPAEGIFRRSRTSETVGTGFRSWKWQQFVNVMLDIGFDVCQGSGSAVSFEHPSGMGRIVFHQPHPEPIIDPVMLRFMGRRMNRWFGWQRETFVERE
ncbi:hypothetical protein N0V82_000585 [Gnomoniopsis sp. IMI 355080]|nr:hypothetical protein N0V82_000585 [Gnomoniopsis sp. IMI 355080]